ncbi:MAG TPA: hypothetical protein VMY39_08780 [Planctomycetota bacterium]|nr:hypothetical protein [Planctomycetota bacterium]
MTLMLLASSSVALLLLAVHCARERSLRRALVFLVGGTAYGILRGNVVYYAYAAVKGGAPGSRPYVPEAVIVPRIGQASLQVALGWVFALYLAFTVAELVVRRLPRLRGRVFVISALAGVFMLSICYCTETVAVTAGWWRWTLPTRSTLFGDVNASAMWAWFTVAFEFLMPFLVIHRDEPRYWWVSLVFVPHLLGHLFLGNFPNAYLTHAVIALAGVLLMLFSRRRMLRGELRTDGTRTSQRVSWTLFVAALGIFVTVLTIASLLSGGETRSLLTLVPMLLMCLLAWRRVPVWGVAALSGVAVLAWPWAGARALYALVPVACFGVLWLMDRLGEPRWLKLALAAAALVAVVAAVAAERADQRRAGDYLSAWREGDVLMRDGNSAAALEAWERARRLRPHETFRMYEALRKAVPEADVEGIDGEQRRERLSRLAVEYEELVRRDPGWTPPRDELVALRRRLAEAR